MKEKFIPSSEDVKKAEEMMTREEKKMSKERKATFDAGKTSGHKEILEYNENKKYLEFRGITEKFADEIGLSKELKKLYNEQRIHYFNINGMWTLHPLEGLTEEQIIELVEKIPVLDKYDEMVTKFILV